MSVINVSEDDTFDQFRQKTNAISTAVGDTTTLTTTATDTVDAINEILGEVGDVSLLNPASPTLVGAINNAQQYAYRITLALG
jgi:hypothetical protein